MGCRAKQQSSYKWTCLQTAENFMQNVPAGATVRKQKMTKKKIFAYM